MKNGMATHRITLADVGPALVRGGHSGTISVVHVAGHVTGILAELQAYVRPVPSRGQRPTVVQLTAGGDDKTHRRAQNKPVTVGFSSNRLRSNTERPAATEVVINT